MLNQRIFWTDQKNTALKWYNGHELFKLHLSKIGTFKTNHQSKEVNLPTLQEIYDEIKKSRENSLHDAVKLSLITKKHAKSYNCSCELKPFVNSKVRAKKLKGRTVLGRAITSVFQLRSITLKNFAEKFENETVESNSPYVEIYRNEEKRVVVKKHRSVGY